MVRLDDMYRNIAIRRAIGFVGTINGTVNGDIAAIRSIIRMGWSIRYKSRLSLSYPDGGEPYYIPGFGKNDGNAWGGTVNIIFDVGKTAKKVKSEK